jgi:hypothetical protein
MTEQRKMRAVPLSPEQIMELRKRNPDVPAPAPNTVTPGAGQGEVNPNARAFSKPSPQNAPASFEQGFSTGNIEIPPMPKGPVTIEGERSEPLASDMMGLLPEDKEPPKEFPVYEETVERKKSGVKIDFDSITEREDLDGDDSLYERWEPPSRGLFYDWKDLKVRRFNLDDLTIISKAVRHRNHTLLIDGLGATINQNIRDLTIPDFYHLMMHHRLYSYLKSPFTITWKSKYGNDNETTIKNSKIIETELTITPEEANAWVAKGFSPPRVRDLEIVQSNEMDEDTKFQFDRAQFIDLSVVKDKVEELRKLKRPSPTVEARVWYLKKLCSRSLEFLEELREFRLALGDYGVKETVKVKDSKFDAATWLASLKEDMKQLEALKALKPELDIDRESDFVNAEISSLELKLDAGEKVEPAEEEVPLAFSVWSMFPGI